MQHHNLWKTQAFLTSSWRHIYPETQAYLLQQGNKCSTAAKCAWSYLAKRARRRSDARSATRCEWISSWKNSMVFWQKLQSHHTFFSAWPDGKFKEVCVSEESSSSDSTDVCVLPQRKEREQTNTFHSVGGKQTYGELLCMYRHCCSSWEGKQPKSIHLPGLLAHHNHAPVHLYWHFSVKYQHAGNTQNLKCIHIEMWATHSFLAEKSHDSSWARIAPCPQKNPFSSSCCQSFLPVALGSISPFLAIAPTRINSVPDFWITTMHVKLSKDQGRTAILALRSNWKHTFSAGPDKRKEGDRLSKSSLGPCGNKNTCIFIYTHTTKVCEYTENPPPEPPQEILSSAWNSHVKSIMKTNNKQSSILFSTSKPS